MVENLIMKLEGITKEFPGVIALSDVDFDLRKGEIHAILGENGAGKSTIIKIMGGVYTRDAGRILLEGQEKNFKTPRQAQNEGIRVIHQELNLISSLSVAENIFLGNLPGNGLPGFVDRKKLYDNSNKILKKLHLNLDIDALAKTLSPGEQQIVEIAQALTTDVRILIMDEPTSALSDSEVVNLFELMKRLKDDEVSIVYISHSISEVLQIADRVTVLRDGEKVGTKDVKDTNASKLIQMMVGRPLEDLYPRSRISPKKSLLELKSVFTKDWLKDISFHIREGEILGVYGLVGAGQAELAYILNGMNRPSSGTIYVKGKPTVIRNPGHAKKLSIGYIPAKRKERALVLPLSVRKNLTVGNLKKYTKSVIFLDERKEKKEAKSWIQKLDIRTTSMEANISKLSGGNQQKTVFGRLLDSQPEILILNEPTIGIDVAAKTEIYKLVDKLCKQSVGVLLFSSEMTELLGVADRILVMSSGRITGEFMYNEATQEKLMQCAIS